MVQLEAFPNLRFVVMLLIALLVVIIIAINITIEQHRKRKGRQSHVPQTFDVDPTDNPYQPSRVQAAKPTGAANPSFGIFLVILAMLIAVFSPRIVAAVHWVYMKLTQ